MKKRILALIMAAALIFALAAGCGNGGDGEPEDSEAPETSGLPEGTEEPAAPTEDALYPLTEDDVTLTYFASIADEILTASETYNNTFAWKKTAEVTGVNVEFTCISASSYAEQIGIQFTAGDLCDYMENVRSYYTGGIEAAVEDGVVMDLKALIESLAPNYMSYLGRDEASKKAAMTDSGYMPYFISFYSDELNTANYGLQMRGDWLDELDISPESLKTYEDYHNVLTQFKSQHDATLLLQSAGCFYSNVLVGGYGVAGYLSTGMFASAPFYQVDGQVKFGMMEDGYFDYLSMIHQWYSEGLISDSFMQQESFVPDETLIYDESVGMWSTHYSLIANYNANNNVEGFYVATAADPLAEGVDAMHFSTNTGLVNLGTTIEVSAGCEYPELAVQVMDYRYSDEGVLLTNYGVEGETFQYGDDGNPQFTDLMLNNENGLGFNLNVDVYLTSPGAQVYDNAVSELAYSEAELSAREIFGSNRDNACSIPSAVTMTADENSQYDGKFTDIATYISENIIKFIIGEKSLDEYDSFKAQLVDMGIEDCIALQQAALDRYNAR